MKLDRTKILKPELRINSSKIKWCFISDYYDGPVEGLLYFKGKIHRFCCFPEDIGEQSIYVIIPLTPDELQKELAEKERFETMVGTHWSYDEQGNPLPPSRATSESEKRYYQSRKKGNPTEPYDRTIIAWFDLADE